MSTDIAEQFPNTAKIASASFAAIIVPLKRCVVDKSDNQTLIKCLEDSTTTIAFNEVLELALGYSTEIAEYLPQAIQAAHQSCARYLFPLPKIVGTAAYIKLSDLRNETIEEMTEFVDVGKDIVFSWLSTIHPIEEVGVTGEATTH
jgi:hypothetical protein